MAAGIPLARRPAGALEPIAGQAQFSPECHRNEEALGFPPNPGMVGRTAVPDACGFFTSRGSVLALADAATMWSARLDGAAAQLRRTELAQPIG
jgi:hypothetical protein